MASKQLVSKLGGALRSNAPAWVHRATHNGLPTTAVRCTASSRTTSAALSTSTRIPSACSVHTRHSTAAATTSKAATATTSTPSLSCRQFGSAAAGRSHQQQANAHQQRSNRQQALSSFVATEPRLCAFEAPPRSTSGDGSAVPQGMAQHGDRSDEAREQVIEAAHEFAQMKQTSVSLSDMRMFGQHKDGMSESMTLKAAALFLHREVGV